MGLNSSQNFSQNQEQEKQIDASFNSSEVQEFAKISLDFLAGLAMPLIFTFCYPPVFIAVWQWLCSYVVKVRSFSRLALGLPRGFGKTTVVKLFVLWCILFTNKKFILIISATATLAENIVADICDMLDEPNIQKTFGNWRLGIEKETQSLKKFGFRGRPIIIAGLGAGGSLRGLNVKNERPDVMIFEDVQTRECADSEVQSDSLYRWMIGTAMKAKSPLGCLYLFVANMYPTKHSILRKLKLDPTWIKFIVGGILQDGTSLWEELQPIAQLKEEFKGDMAMGHPEIFYSEVLNDESATANLLIEFSKLPPVPFVPGDIHQGNFIVIDPSSSRKLNSDKVAIGYFEVYDSKPVLMEILHQRLSPGETIHETLKLALKYNCNLVVVESVAYQSTLLYWFEFICQQKEIKGIYFLDIYPGGSSKNSRILTMLKSYRAGEIFVADSEKALVHSQVMEFNPLKTDNEDDILDCLCYAPKVVEVYGNYLLEQTVIKTAETLAIKVLPAELTSCF